MQILPAAAAPACVMLWTPGGGRGECGGIDPSFWALASGAMLLYDPAQGRQRAADSLAFWSELRLAGCPVGALGSFGGGCG